MDPNTNLKEMRQLSREILEIWNRADPEDGTLDVEQAERVSEKAERFAELFAGLDHWITKRGALPREWRKH